MQQLWTSPGKEWPSSLHDAIGVLLWKRKGNRDDVSTYRMIVLLSVGSRLLAKIVAARLRTHSEALQLLPPSNRSTSGVLLMLRIISELARKLVTMLTPYCCGLFRHPTRLPQCPTRDTAYQVFKHTFGIPDQMITVV